MRKIAAIVLGLLVMLSGCSDDGVNVADSPPSETVPVAKACLDRVMTAHESDLISDLVAPATECSLIEWAAAFNFAGDSPMSLLGTVCDTRAENRGFTPAGFSSGNPLCGAYRSEECGESGSYEHITEACYDKYAVYEAELANDRA